MADQIQELIAGQAPSLMQAEKGNELIQAINAIKRSRGLNGIEVKIDKAGELVISQDRPQERTLVFYFANGYKWIAKFEDIMPAVAKEFWSLQFYIDGTTGTLDHAYENEPTSPVTFQEDDTLEDDDPLYDGDEDTDQTYTRVPVIIAGRYVNTSGVWQESTICQDGVPIQQFIKI